MFPLGDKFLCLLFPSYIRDINFCCGERTPGNLHLPPSPRLPPRLLTMFQLEHHCWCCNFPAPACVCTKRPPLPREAGTCPKHSSPAGLTPWEQPKPFATYPWQRRSKDTSTDELQNLGPAQGRAQRHSLVQEHLGQAQAAALQIKSFPTSLLQPLFFPSPPAPSPGAKGRSWEGRPCREGSWGAGARAGCSGLAGAALHTYQQTSAQQPRMGNAAASRAPRPAMKP